MFGSASQVIKSTEKFNKKKINIYLVSSVCQVYIALVLRLEMNKN